MKLPFSNTANEVRRLAISRRSAFTMVEIALCLAIVGFALVAIIGVLPAGLNVQKENREETIINQEATIWMDALRSGGTNQFGVFDDLTNYVDRVGVESYYYDTPLSAPAPNPAGTFNFTAPLITGYQIVGALNTPQLIPGGRPGSYYSNYVYAYVRAGSGNAADKSPQDNPDVRDLAFTYKLIVQSTPAGGFDPWYGDILTNATDVTVRQNLTDVRLLFRWPLKQPFDPVMRPAPPLGNSRLAFKTQISGRVENTGLLFYRQPNTFKP